MVLVAMVCRCDVRQVQCVVSAQHAQQAAVATLGALLGSCIWPSAPMVADGNSPTHLAHH